MGVIANLLGPPATSSPVAMIPLSSNAAPTFQTFARQGYQGNPIIFSAINLISTSASEPHIAGKRWRRNRRSSVTNKWTDETISDRQARGQLKAEERWLKAHGVMNRAGRRMLDAWLVRNGYWEEVDDHPLVKLLNNPNPFMSRGQLWGTVTMDYHLAGNAYVYKARYADGFLEGAVGELWRLRPDRMKVVPGDGYIKGWEYSVGNGVPPKFLPAADVMHFKTRAPLDDYYGMPPLMPVLGRMAIETYQERFLRQFYETGGTGPGAILSTEDEMDQASKDDIRDRMRRQFGVAGNFLELMILDNAKNVKYESMGLNRGLRDALPNEIYSITEAQLSMVLGVPGTILGLLIGYENMSLAGKRADWQVLWDVKMTPMLSDFDDVLNLSMTPEFGNIDELFFDTSDIRALQEDEDALQDRARKNLLAGGLSFPAYRLAIGEQPEPEPDELFFVPSSHVVTPYSRMGEEPEEPDSPPALMARALTMIEARVGRRRIEDDEDAWAMAEQMRELKGKGLTIAQIATRLSVSESTVKRYGRRLVDNDDD